jgi:hypothetical protein
MTNEDIELHISRWLAWGGLAVTVFVSAWWSQEPVNAPKMLLLAGVGGAVLFSLIVGIARKALRLNILLLCSVLLFNFAAFISMMFSSQSTALNFFGIYGRNTGFLTYFTLSICLLASSAISNRSLIQKIVKGFFIAGLINLIYCLLSMIGIELLPWNNIFGGTLLGTLGNPNFIGSFLGMVVVGFISMLARPGVLFYERILLSTGVILGMIEIKQTHAVQGLVIVGSGTLFVLGAVVLKRIRSQLVLISYGLFATTLATMALLGALQIGPLKEIIYKSSVSFRGVYWNAGLKMGFDNLATGVGMDQYWAWYRRARGSKAFDLLGTDTVTNAAHNVFLDIFAYGGIPLFTTYVVIIMLVVRSSIKLLTKNDNYDGVAITLITVWFSYQLQSIISINQIGLAVWGWIFGGLVIAYERIKSADDLSPSKIAEKTTKGKKSRPAPVLVPPSLLLGSTVLCVVGLIVASPPLLADANYRNALKSREIQKIVLSIKKWPQDPQRIDEVVVNLMQSNMLDQGFIASQYSIEKFPDNYIAWLNYSKMPNLPVEKKNFAISQLKRLDPLNPLYQNVK